MKKVSDLLMPNILIVFGALLFLYYLNWLSYGGAGLAIGIFAVIISVYYLAIGILTVVLGDKLSPMVRKIFDVISVSLFGIFMFVYFLLITINAAQAMGPTSWTIEILSMVASLALVAFFVISRFVNKPALLRFAYLFSAIFALVLLLNILFNIQGQSTKLGEIDILLTVIYIIFVLYLFNSLGKAEPKQVETPEEKEPDPAEE